MMQQGKFYPFVGSNLGPQWIDKELASFKALLDAGVSSKKGVAEKVLLDWFGASPERIALLAYSTHGIAPTSVGREIILGDFRADFAWIAVDKHLAPAVSFIEFEAALPNTLFDDRPGRRVPYIGAKFLEGLSQLVDWRSFGLSEATNNALISAELKGDHRLPAYNFTLVAGLSEFVEVDQSLQKRANWWKHNIDYGDGANMFTFTEVHGYGCRRRAAHLAMT